MGTCLGWARSLSARYYRSLPRNMKPSLAIWQERRQLKDEMQMQQQQQHLRMSHQMRAAAPDATPDDDGGGGDDHGRDDPDQIDDFLEGKGERRRAPVDRGLTPSSD